jgi:indolepyruvate ferredoxin oxidoreductase
VSNVSRSGESSDESTGGEARDRYRLDDRYTRDDGRVFISGAQALARLPLEQLRADRRAGLNTAAYVSGYPGSPLAGFDRDVTAAAKLAAAGNFDLVFQPGLNEELAATAVMGSQLAATLASCRYDGVIGMWYGKGPGIDRASDAIRHAVFAGSSAKGGAVALVGDDPKAKSSTIPSASEATLIDLHMPVLYPGDVQEAIDLGRHAIAISRASGLWSAIKIVEAVADGTGTADLHANRITTLMPEFLVDGKQYVPQPSASLLPPNSVAMERDIFEVRTAVATQYGHLNRLNTIPVRGGDDWIGIVAAGHTYHEVMEALSLLGLRSVDDLRGCGVRLLKIAMPYPIEESLIREFADGLAEILVIEEKAPLLERLVKDVLYASTVRPIVVGKHAPDGSPVVPGTGTFDADLIAPRIRLRLQQRLADRLAPPPPATRQLIPLAVNRTPYFCSGCPHNSSTKVPDGALVGGGIGCHSMVMLMEPGRTGDIVGLSAMGTEGSQWFGMAPFVDTPHLFQNIGDGTLFHSGMLAIRAAVANGANITYKLLYNGAVAMTGGQDPFGQLDVVSVVKVFLAEGVKQVLITTDEVGNYRDVDLPPGVHVWGRSRLIEAQQLLAQVPGCTVLIHDQRCAAEKRRDRKRGRIDKPPFKVVINERVCEGCGDCGDVSNCLSVQPVDTPFGRKTRIDQSSCNFDLSCMQGDCPSFMSVTPGRGRQQVAARESLPTTPLPQAPVADLAECTIRLSGIGGTGVVTISQILGTAAMLADLHVRGLDQTGLSQKAGPVVSDLRLSRDRPLSSNKATIGSVDVLLAFDQLVAMSDGQIAASSADHTAVVANSSITPTGSMVVHPDMPFPSAAIGSRLAGSTRRQVFVDATSIVEHLFGDDTTANVFLVGVALQSGLLPLDAEVIERAIELNGVAVDKNLAALAAGRRWVCDPQAVQAAAGLAAPAVDDRPTLVRYVTELAAYQSAAYAARYQSVVDRVATRGFDVLTETVATNLYKLMAYKDEYEVARLLLLPESKAAVEAIGGKGARVQWHLHPPLLRAMGMRNKLRLGRWATPLFVGLRGMRRLRGTPVDVFGWAKVRRVERAMIDEYIAAVDVLVAHVDDASLDEAIAIAALPDQVRGYEHLKMQRANVYRAELSRRIAVFA